MPRRSRTVLAAFALAALGATPAVAQSLRGSSSSLDIQNRIAREHDFTYIRTSSQVRRFVAAGYLVPVRSNADFDLHAVSFPYARPQVELFIRRLANQYRRACGEKLVVTSLTRPTSRQPRNASDRSVHPTGMAIDLRRSNDRNCRAWLEDVLLNLERAGLLEATRERYPPHYHVALFPRQYERYVQRLASRADAPRRAAAEARKVSAETTQYRVRRGDSLWTIARRHGLSVDEIRSSNDLRSSRIYAGQLLKLPVASR